MNKYKTKNEKIKRRYLKWLKDAEGFAPATIESIEKSLWDYETFSQEDDYANFNYKMAQGFKKWLSNGRYMPGHQFYASSKATHRITWRYC